MFNVNYTRRNFLKAAGLTVAFLAGREYIYASNESSRKPNVILVLTDDQGYEDLSCHGNPVVKTPNIDKLRSESVRLTNFHVSPTCSPTRASLMTGRYCNRTGVWHTIMGRSLLRKDEITMADVFAANGYNTSIFGKWHLGDNYPFRAQDRGFDKTLVHKGGGVGQGNDYWGNDYFDDTYFRNGHPEKFEGYCTDIWFDEAMEFIESNKDRPFFCYLPTNAAHGPYHVPEKYSKPYKDKGINSPTAEFYGMITNIDDNMGRLTDKLDKLGLSENTILIFMTDNGADPAGRSEDNFNTGMHGWKGSEYDGGHRVPFFIRWPTGHIEGSRDIGRITAHIDVLPTLIELCSLEPADIDFDGSSLVPLLKGETRNWPNRIIITDSQRVNHPIKWRKSATMTDKWRLVNGKELYDINKDLKQKNNIADKHPDVVRRLRGEYEKWWDDVSKRFDEYCRIIIGSENENPTCLMTHDIHGQVVWNQNQVRQAARADGFWAIEVERDGTYEFELRRWPKEIDKPISVVLDKNEDEPYSGRITATDARLTIADFDVTKPVMDKATSVKFNVPLKAGKTNVQAWFVNGLGDGRTYGAYYVYAKRL